jgi:hypothetical protein
MRRLLFLFFVCSSAGFFASMIILASQYDGGIIPSWVFSFLPGNTEVAVFSGKNFYIFGIPAVLIAGIVFLWSALLSAVMMLSGYVSSMLSLVLSSLSWILFGAFLPYVVMRIISLDFHSVHLILYGSSFLSAVVSGVLLRSEKRRDAKFLEEAAKSLLSFREQRGRFMVMIILLIAVMSGAIVSIANISFDLYSEKERLVARNNVQIAGEFVKQKKEFLSLPETPVITGNKTARVKIAVFTDPFCPACISFYRTEKSLLKKFGKDISFYHYMYPLVHECNPSISGGSNSLPCDVSKMIYAAALTGQLDFFLHRQTEESGGIKKLFEKKRPRIEIFRKYFGTENGFKEFDGIVSSAKSRERLKLDIAFANSLGISKTPTVFINGKRLNSFAREDLLRYIIEEELRK